jgi:hypothetical protein
MTTLVASLVILTLAAGTMAPDESCTVPVMVPRSDCARMEPAPNTPINANTAKQLRTLNMEPLLTALLSLYDR